MKGDDGMGSAKNRTALLAFFGKFQDLRKEIKTLKFMQLWFYSLRYDLYKKCMIAGTSDNYL